jgi:hypothetical protein
MGKESNAEGTIRRVGFALAHGGMWLDKQGIHVRWKLWPHRVERRLDHPSLELA